MGSGSDGSGSSMTPVHPAHAEVREKERITQTSDRSGTDPDVFHWWTGLDRKKTNAHLKPLPGKRNQKNLQEIPS